MNVWKRVKMKLDGRDPDVSHRLSVAEQVCTGFTKSEVYRMAVLKRVASLFSGRLHHRRSYVDGQPCRAVRRMDPMGVSIQANPPIFSWGMGARLSNLNADINFRVVHQPIQTNHQHFGWRQQVCKQLIVMLCLALAAGHDESLYHYATCPPSPPLS